MTPTAHRYIVSRPEILGGEPVVEGTRTPVRAVVALSYYSGHTPGINEYIEANRLPEAER